MNDFMKKKITLTESQLVELIKDVILEQENDEIPLYFRRRIPLIEKLLEEAVDEVGDEQSMFDDMFDFATYVIGIVVNNLTSILPENDALIQDEDELENLIKDYYSDDIFQHYVPSDEDEDEDEDDEIF